MVKITQLVRKVLDAPKTFVEILQPAPSGWIGCVPGKKHSRSSYGVPRGMHYQDMTAPMGKLLRCTVGRIFDVAVDLLVSSPTFGKWFSVELSADNKKQIYVPVGFAHGFATLSDVAEVQYKQTSFYTPSSEGTLAWNDPDVGIQWPLTSPTLSKRDQNGMSLKEYLKKPAFK